MTKTAIARATRRVRNRRGDYYLTHGGDTCDKKGLSKARRALDIAIIQEHLEEDENVTETKKNGSETYRVVVVTQCYENYGSEKTPYWKPKGGNEHIHVIGSASDVIALGNEGIQQIVNDLTANFTDNDMFNEHMIDWYVAPTSEKTEDELMYEEMLIKDWM